MPFRGGELVCLPKQLGRVTWRPCPVSDGCIRTRNQQDIPLHFSHPIRCLSSGKYFRRRRHVDQRGRYEG